MSNIVSGPKQPSLYCLIYLCKRLLRDLCPYVLFLNYRCRRHLSENLGLVRKRPNYFGYEICKIFKGDRVLISIMGSRTLGLKLSLENWDLHCKIFPSNMIQFKYSISTLSLLKSWYRSCLLRLGFIGIVCWGWKCLVSVPVLYSETKVIQSRPWSWNWKLVLQISEYHQKRIFFGIGCIALIPVLYWFFGESQEFVISI